MGIEKETPVRVRRASPLPSYYATPYRKRLADILLPGLAPKEDGEGLMTYRGPYPKHMQKLKEGMEAVFNSRGARFEKHLPYHVILRGGDKPHLAIRVCIGGLIVDFGSVHLSYHSQYIENAARLADAFAYHFRTLRSHGKYNFPEEQAKADCEHPPMKELLGKWRKLIHDAGHSAASEDEVPKKKAELLADTAERLDHVETKLETVVKSLQQHLGLQDEQIKRLEAQIANLIEGQEELDRRTIGLVTHCAHGAHDLPLQTIDPTPAPQNPSVWCGNDKPFTT